MFLDSTVGRFLDETGDDAATAARHQALLDFVRGGKGLAGIHGASDAYHGGTGAAPFARPGSAAAAGAGPGRGAFGGGAGGAVATAMISQGDKNGDQKLSRDEFMALCDSWFAAIDTAKSGTVVATDFAQRLTALVPAAQPAAGGRAAGGRGGPGGAGAEGATSTAGRGSAPSGSTWPEYSQMIGGIFKGHPWQEVPVKIDDTKSPLTAAFKSPTFTFQDETYTFYMDSWSRKNLHVLMSIDYAKMSDADKASESNASARTDGDYGLSWIRREGRGRVFYLALGHREDGVYRSPEMLHLMLAGIQYAIGDLKADDSPSSK